MQSGLRFVDRCLNITAPFAGARAWDLCKERPLQRQFDYAGKGMAAPATRQALPRRHAAAALALLDADDHLGRIDIGSTKA
jgi:hypothetical protein